VGQNALRESSGGLAEVGAIVESRRQSVGTQQ
jgi:hypothetical protein